MFCKSGSIQSESYLFCAEKNVWRDGTFRVYSYLRCSFLLLFQALCIKQRLFYGPSFHVTVAVKVQYLTPLLPAGSRLARQSQPPVRGPVASASSTLGPTSSCLACCLGDQPSREAPGRVSGPPAIKAGRPCGQWAQPLPRGQLPHGSLAPRSPPACPAASHAKDNSNSPLGLSQRPSAIDGEVGSPPPMGSLFCIQVCFPPPFRFFLAHSPLEEAPVFLKLREGGQRPLKIPKMFTELGAELQGSGLTSHNQRVRQALLTATPQAC